MTSFPTVLEYLIKIKSCMFWSITQVPLGLLRFKYHYWFPQTYLLQDSLIIFQKSLDYFEKPLGYHTKHAHFRFWSAFSPRFCEILALTYGPGPYGPGPSEPWSWTIHNLKEFSKLNMLQDHIWNPHCSGIMFAICSWSSTFFKYCPGAYLTWNILQDC